MFNLILNKLPYVFLDDFITRRRKQMKKRKMVLTIETRNTGDMTTLS